ncbi:MAG: SRPBCC domain-containing protein [Acidobacteria bacterium]|nr:SRPBCC domain-containing protein [Acidobacteriota bacterium]
MREFAHTVVITAPPAAVLDAFFEAESLAAWWGVTRAICVPRALGAYAVEWAPAGRREESPGRLEGTLHGTVMEFKPGEEFFVADLYWHPPNDDPIGPMALEATCRMDGAVTHLHLRQSGHDKDSERWSRYYDVMTARWEPALEALKQFLEKRWAD